MEDNKSQVYIRADEQNRILRCEGGYSMSNITNLDEWTLIDEGNGDRYNLCQTHYFEGGLYTFDGIPRWAYEDGAVRERTEAEIAADRVAREAEREAAERERIANATETVLLEMAAEHEERICLIEMGITEEL